MFLSDRCCHTQARQRIAAGDRNPRNAVEIDFDEFTDFEICAASFTPIYAGEQSESCPFDGTKYHTKYKGTVCKVCEVCAVGAPGSGLRLTV